MKKIIIILTFFLGINSNSQAQKVQIEDLLDKGQINAAIDRLEEKSLRNRVDESEILLLGDLYSFVRKWDDAIEKYERLIDLHPQNPEYNFKYGGALGMKSLEVSKFRALTLIPDVKKHLEKAAALDPAHVQSRRALVELYMQLPGLLGGSEEKARNFAAEIEPHSKIDALLANAYIHSSSGNEKQAIDLYRQALISTKPLKAKKENYLNYELGESAAKYGLEPQLGLAFLNTYLTNYSYRDVHPTEWVHYRKAQIYVFLREKEEAIQAINKALSLKKDFKEAEEERMRILKM